MGLGVVGLTVWFAAAAALGVWLGPVLRLADPRRHRPPDASRSQRAAPPLATSQL